MKGTDSPRWVLCFSLTLFSWLLCTCSFAQEKHFVLFYNVENLFDPFNDPSTNDDEYTSQGASHWTRERFNTKIRMIYKAVIAGCLGNYPDVLGLAEIENRWVLDQLISKTPFKDFPYGIVHKESPDPRGIDVALLYRKDRITPLDVDFFEVSEKGKKGFSSRDILYFKGKIEGITVHFFVNHWPSRSEGFLESREKRAVAAKVLRSKIDSLLVKEKNPLILITGDFNAAPGESSMTKILKSSVDLKSADHSLINLSRELMKKWGGTIYRAGQWEIFDQFICSSSLIRKGELAIQPKETRICALPFLLEKDQKYLREKPFRTYVGPVYHGGFSDHLPIVTVLQKN